MDMDTGPHTTTIQQLANRTSDDPQTIIEATKQQYSAPEDQVEALSLAILQIHQTSSYRIQQLEASLEEIIIRLNKHQTGIPSDAESNATKDLQPDQ
jgi:hypothetical protein